MFGWDEKVDGKFGKYGLFHKRKIRGKMERSRCFLPDPPNPILSNWREKWDENRDTKKH